MPKTLQDYREQAEEIVGRIVTHGIGSAIFGSSGRDGAKDAVAMELFKAYEDGRRDGKAERASRKRKDP